MGLFRYNLTTIFILCIALFFSSCSSDDDNYYIKEGALNYILPEGTEPLYIKTGQDGVWDGTLGWPLVGLEGVDELDIVKKILVKQSSFVVYLPTGNYFDMGDKILISLKSNNGKEFSSTYIVDNATIDSLSLNIQNQEYKNFISAYFDHLCKYKEVLVYIYIEILDKDKNPQKGFLFDFYFKSDLELHIRE